MNFLKEIRDHLNDFETQASDEIHKFIDFLHSRYQEPSPAVVAPPAPLAEVAASTFTPAVDSSESLPVAVVDNIPDVPEPIVDAPVVAEAEPTAVVEPTAPVVEEEEAVEEVKSSKKAK